MGYNTGEQLIVIMMGLLIMKFIYMFYQIGKELQAYLSTEEAKRAEAERQREAEQKRRAEAYEERKKRAQAKSHVHKTYTQTPPRRSRFEKELAFFTNCSNHYEILGCSIYDSAIAIKKSYRSLVRKWHPDRIVSMGVSKEEIEEATLIIQIINTAYEKALQGAVGKSA